MNRRQLLASLAAVAIAPSIPALGPPSATAFAAHEAFFAEVQNAFLSNLFATLNAHPNMTATEVIEHINSAPARWVTG